jgi:DNA-binding LacI/PurR family transcriptional regulator
LKYNHHYWKHAFQAPPFNAELCRLHGLGIPDDVDLIGVRNDELICELCNPPLSSVPFTSEQAGYQAAELPLTEVAGAVAVVAEHIRHSHFVVYRSKI